MASGFLRTVFRAWYALRMVKLRNYVHPTDSSVTRTGDPRADRVLLVGNGHSRGWGVASHQLGLTGQLARAIEAKTGRGCDLDLIGAESMNARSALSWIGTRDLEEFDAFVLAVGLNDALRLTPLDDFERGLADVLDGVVARLRPEAVVTVVGIPPIRSLPAFSGLATATAISHRQALNRATRRITSGRRLDYLEVPQLTNGASHPLGAAATYAQLGGFIAAEVAPQLVLVRPDPPVRPPQADPIWDWSGTAALVALAAQGGAPELNRLAAEAQKAFKVELAVVSLVNGDRLYYGNNTDVMPESVPLDLSFCQYTVAAEAPVIIPDTRADPRFDDNPLIELSYINFYAGYPLRSSEGQVIGSFCLQGSRPRDASDISMDALRDLAMQAQAEIQRYEVPKGPPAPTGPAYTFR
ncbi:MAG: GAF domain-containing protein [Pseudolysinimonas sp.]|uniref:GAF domain-containing protein n=1 Tax=Pseudolysinimonas sp. TaxID=2680009 RepID=UPI003267D837